MSTASFTQVTARVRNDDGTEATATWRQAQSTNDTVSANQRFRVRFRIDETASVAWTNVTWNLRYSLNGGAYTAVSASTPIQFSASANFVDAADCTAQLTGGTGTFVADNNGMKETTGGAVNSGSAGFLFEAEWSLLIDPAQVAVNDTIDLRVYNGTSAIAAYTFTPRITVGQWQANVSDSSTASETRSTDGTTSSADSSTGTEALSSVSAISVADTSTASESITIINGVNVADTSSASETQSVSGSGSVTDTSTASESFSGAGTISTADTSTGAETQTGTGATSLADSSTGTESQSGNGAVSVAQSSTVTETNDHAEIAGDPVINDASAAGESMSFDVTMVVSDSAAASETDVFLGVIGLADTVEATEQLVAGLVITVTDASTGADVPSYGAAVSFAVPVFVDLDSGESYIDVQEGCTELELVSGETYIDLERL